MACDVLNKTTSSSFPIHPCSIKRVKPAQVAAPSGDEEIPCLPKEVCACLISSLETAIAVPSDSDRIETINSPSGGLGTRIPVGLEMTLSFCAVNAPPRVQVSTTG